MNPRVIGANLVVSLKSFYREKSAMFFTVAFPILLILLFGMIFSNTDTVNFDLQVQDLDQTNASAALLKKLELNGTFTITKVDPSLDAAKYAKDNKVNLVLVVPRGYQSALINRTAMQNQSATAAFKIIYDPSSSAANTKMQILGSVFSGMNQGISQTSPFIVYSTQSVLSKKYRYIEFFVPGIIAMSVMTSSLFGTVNMNAELRQKGVIRKLSTTPITRADWILSNIMYQFILALMSTASILIVAYLAFQLNIQINGWLFVFIILDVFAFAGIGMLLTRFAKEAESAYAAANAIMFPMMFLSGSFFALEMMPPYLREFAKVLPLYYVNEGLRMGMVFQDNVTALLYAAIIGVFAAAMFVLGVLLTDWKEGK